MSPDVERAALMATETLIRNQVITAPIDPMPILKRMPNVLVTSFADIAERACVDRSSLLTMFGNDNQDAGTIVAASDDGVLHYFVAYNQRLPYALVQRAIARELGHIVLGHDGSRPDDVRTEEALIFARHLLCPRPLLAAIRDSGVPLTVELIGSVTGCRKRCLDGIRVTPGAHVPPELNRLVREQFADYVDNFVSYARSVQSRDDSPLAEFGTYFDNYCE